MQGEPTFGLLGPVEAWVEGVPVALGGPHNRALLAVLLLQRSRVVPLADLVDAVWGTAAPASARAQAQNRIAALRRTLARHGAPDDLIVTSGSGYLLSTGTGRCDADVFDRLVLEAADLPDEPAADRLTAALAVWRGPALDGLRGPGLIAAAQRLDEGRLTARIRLVDAQLRLGRVQEATGSLYELVSAHPWHEQLVGRLMTALHRADRQHDALTEYDRLRRALAAELGVDPGPELRESYARILRGEPAPVVAVAGPPEPPARPARTVPRQLPRGVPDFVARDDQLTRLDALLAAGTTPAVAAIVGTAGIGKTTLAVHWAHRVAHRFPDGQLYVDLHGFDPAGPSAAAETVRTLLEVLEVPAWRVPAGLAAQLALYRTELADRRMLIVLDNARDDDQIRDLLPGSGSCVVVATSRHLLSGLAVRDGAQVLALDLFSLDEACRLLQSRIGAERAAADTAAVAEIAGRCARLPLALAVAGARAAIYPEVPLQELAQELRETENALDAFDERLMATDLRALFSWSYRTLSPDAARLFRLVGLHPGPDCGVPAAAALAGWPVRQARVALFELCRANLLDEHTTGRFAFHDLLRAYAVELAGRYDDADRQARAVRRLADHYLRTTYRAAVRLNRHRHPITLVPAEEDGGPAPGGPEPATWFETEQPVLLRMVRFTAGHGLAAHTWQLTWALFDVLDRSGRWHELVNVAGTAVEAARRAGDPAGQAHGHGGLTRAYVRLREFDRARPHADTALRLFAELGDEVHQAYTHRGLGGINAGQGRHEDALHHDLRALELYRRLGDRSGEAYALNSAGWSYGQLGRYAEALDHCGPSLARHREAGDRYGEASALDSLGYLYHRTGDVRSAATHLAQALEIYRALGDRYLEADTLAHLGDLAADNGNDDGARHSWAAALRIFEDLGHPEAGPLRDKLAGEAGANSMAPPAPVV